METAEVVPHNPSCLPRARFGQARPSTHVAPQYSSVRVGLIVDLVLDFVAVRAEVRSKLSSNIEGHFVAPSTVLEIRFPHHLRHDCFWYSHRQDVCGDTRPIRRSVLPRRQGMQTDRRPMPNGVSKHNALDRLR